MSSRARRQEKKRIKMEDQLNQTEIPKNNKSTTGEHWYKKPVGIVFLSVTAAIITAIIIGSFNHFTFPNTSEQVMKYQNAGPTIELNNVRISGFATGVNNNLIPNAQIIMKNKSEITSVGTGIKSNAPNTQVIMDDSKINADKKGIDINIPPKL